MLFENNECFERLVRGFQGLVISVRAALIIEVQYSSDVFLSKYPGFPNHIYYRSRRQEGISFIGVDDT